MPARRWRLILVGLAAALGSCGPDESPHARVPYAQETILDPDHAPMSDGDAEDRDREPPLYPRPGADPPAYAPTPDPRPIAASGTIVGVWDLAGGRPSRDGIAVRHALSAMGIPSERVDRPSQLGGYQVLLVTGELTDGSVSPAMIEKLRAALERGAAVLAVAPRASGLRQLAGISALAPAHEWRELVIPRATDPLLQDFRALSIRRLPLAGPGATAPAVGYVVLPGPAQVLARFDDGSAALVRTGKMYSLGLRAQYHLDLLSGMRLGLREHYTNHHVVQGDLLPLLLRRFYLAHAPRPQVRATAPAGRRAAVVLTHDCDSGHSGTVVPGFAAIERRYGVKATYLVTTTPYKNGNMGAVYAGPLITALRGLLAEGFDVGSHSFGHFWDFDDLPSRLGGESAANYRPYHRGGRTEGGSLFGEVQISRSLLEADLGVRIATFRPGYLVFPSTYYEELRAGGYLRSSTRPSGIVRANFPHRGVTVRPGSYDVHPVIEYPLAISDRELDDTNVREKVADWVRVVERNSVTGAPTVLLLHPSSRPGRAEALEAFLAALAGRDLWIGDLRTFAEFYEGQGF